MRRFTLLLLSALVVCGVCISCHKDTSDSEIVVEKVTIGIERYDVFEEYTVTRVDSTTERPFECYCANGCIDIAPAIAEVEFKSSSAPEVVVEDYPKKDTYNANLSECVSIGDGRWKAVIYTTVGYEAKVTITNGDSMLTFGISAEGEDGDRNMSLLSDNPISEEEFQQTADYLGVEVAVVKAVDEVVTMKKSGFVRNSDRPEILFEGHIFWTELKRQGIDPYGCQKGNEDILYEQWTKAHYKGGEREYDRLYRASLINKTAAYRATSWGAYSIMGNEYSKCGCANIDIFVERMYQSKGAQLSLFAAYLKNAGAETYLAKRDWTGFARCYFGDDYALNRYDEKLAMAYIKYK